MSPPQTYVSKSNNLSFWFKSLKVQEFKGSKVQLTGIIRIVPDMSHLVHTVGFIRKFKQRIIFYQLILSLNF